MAHPTPSFPAHVAAGLLAPLYFAVLYAVVLAVTGTSFELASAALTVAVVFAFVAALVAVLPCAWACRTISRRWLPRAWQQIACCAVPGVVAGMVVAVWLFPGSGPADTWRCLTLMGGLAGLATAAGRASVQWTISPRRFTAARIRAAAAAD